MRSTSMQRLRDFLWFVILHDMVLGSDFTKNLMSIIVLLVIAALGWKRAWSSRSSLWSMRENGESRYLMIPGLPRPRMVDSQRSGNIQSLWQIHDMTYSQNKITKSPSKIQGRFFIIQVTIWNILRLYEKNKIYQLGTMQVDNSPQVPWYDYPMMGVLRKMNQAQ